MGPGLARNYSIDGLVWAQDCHQTMLPMSLHGPRTGTKLWYRWSRMGPALVPNYATDELAWAQDCHQATDDLVWAQDWHQTMLPMSLHGPRTAIKLCYR